MLLWSLTGQTGSRWPLLSSSSSLSLHKIWVSHSASYVTSSALVTVSVTVGVNEIVRISLVRYSVIYTSDNLNVQYADILIPVCWLQSQMFFINQNALIDWYQYQINSFQRRLQYRITGRYWTFKLLHRGAHLTFTCY